MFLCCFYLVATAISMRKKQPLSLCQSGQPCRKNWQNRPCKTGRSVYPSSPAVDSWLPSTAFHSCCSCLSSSRVIRWGECKLVLHLGHLLLILSVYICQAAMCELWAELATAKQEEWYDRHAKQGNSSYSINM